MKECPKCRSCYDGIGLRCAFDSCDLIETLPFNTIIADKYHLECRLGEGQTGVVYRGTQLNTQTTIAIKILIPHRASAKSLAPTFRRQVSAASQLRHPNLVPVIDFGLIEAEDVTFGYIVTEFIEGWPLSTLITDQKRISIYHAFRLLDEICVGLEYAHERGIAHGTLKPQNIWLCSEGVTQEVVKLLDCGLGIEGGDEKLAESYTLIDPGAGTRSTWYISPEQCAGQSPNPRSDIYSLGVIAYEMLTGAPPFMGEPDQVRRKHAGSRPRSLWLWHRVPRKVSKVIHKALAKNPRSRYQSVYDFFCDLQTAVAAIRMPETI
jgi:eukaryotic-like serine/threonine-protein kinase